MSPRAELLIVDDIHANSRLLAKKLSGEYECRIALNGEDALEKVENNAPDLILLDVLMPGMDGFEVCRRLKSNQKTQNIPIIFITSLDEAKEEEKGLALGAADYIHKPFRIPIVKARIRNHLEFKRVRDLLEQQAFTDSLTLLPNRRQFDITLERNWYGAMRNGKQLSIILLDIDFFKDYNDNYGHQKGDDCLRRVGKLLSDSLKRATDFVARYGGEEFAVILSDTNQDEVVNIAKKITLNLAELNILHEYSSVSPAITFSQGVATCIPDMTQSPADIVLMADQALYQSKDEGRNRLTVYTK